jgi:hypothetical protein
VTSVMACSMGRPEEEKCAKSIPLNNGRGSDVGTSICHEMLPLHEPSYMINAFNTQATNEGFWIVTSLLLNNIYLSI